MNLYMMSATNASIVTSSDGIVGSSVIAPNEMQMNPIDGEMVIWLKNPNQEPVFVEALDLLGIDYCVIVDNRKEDRNGKKSPS